MANKYQKALDIIKDNLIICQPYCKERDKVEIAIYELNGAIKELEKLKYLYRTYGVIDYLTYKELKDELEEYKKQEKKIVNKNIKRAYQLMKESGYFDE